MLSPLPDTELRYPALPYNPVRRAASFTQRTAAGEIFLKRPNPTHDVENLIEDWKQALRERSPGSVADNQKLLHLTDLVNTAFVLGRVCRDFDVILAREDVDKIYKDLLMEEGFWDQPVVFIDGVIEGLMRVGIVAHRNALPENPRLRRTVLLDKMLNDAPSLWRHIWDNRRLIRCHTRTDHQYPEEIEPGQKAYTDPMTLLAIQYQQLYSAKFGPNHNAPLDSFIPHVSLYLWAHVSAAKDEPGHDDYAHRPVVAILREISDASENGQERLDFLNEVVPVIGADALVSRWHQLFEGVKAGRIDPKHFLEVGNLMQSLVRNRDVVHSWSQRNMFALSVQMSTSLDLPVPERQTVWITLAGVALLLGDTAHIMLEQDEFNACIRAEDYVAHLANGIYLADGRPAVTDMLNLLNEAIDWIGGAIMASNKSATRRYFGKEYEKSARGAMRHEWYPGLLALRSLKQRLNEPTTETKGATGVITQWYMVGNMLLGINEAKERKRHEQEAPRRCSRMACAYHRRVPEQATGIEMKTCKGCGEVKYCGRECQVKCVQCDTRS
ncbi:hypothetical protein PENSPDRAFT_656051 [Peniophora sp. CONT]|nr:hypothetical protein PENSPDRAFT_656051 [Peniophora sp. CONT]